MGAEAAAVEEDDGGLVRRGKGRDDGCRREEAGRVGGSHFCGGYGMGWYLAMWVLKNVAVVAAQSGLDAGQDSRVVFNRELGRRSKLGPFH